jgi:hypothetical protein
MKTLCKARKRGGRHWYHSNRHDFAYNRPVDPDPMFFGHPGFGSSCQSLEAVLGIRIKGFDDQKFKKNRWKFFISFLKQKIVIYLLLGLHKGCLVYRGSLQPSKENIPHFNTWNFIPFLVVIFSLLDPDPDPLTWLDPDPIRSRFRNTGYTV